MHRVITLDTHGAVVTETRHDTARSAALVYCGVVLGSPGQHVRWVDGDALPGLPDKVQAERFGDPCEGPCCVPLASEWPERCPVCGQPDNCGDCTHQTVTSS